jgi:2-desacetyl-2-hydroxyethyl bacteriochlorophyllide A dehydrogenase
MRNQSIWFTAPREIEIREETLRDPAAYEVLVQTLLTAISPGTEMLIYRGEFPHDLSADSTIAALQSQLAFPLRYGYCAVGKVVALGSQVDPSWMDQLVFSFQPHQRFFVASVEELQRVPEGIPVEDAVFLPNMETAVNFLLDGRPIVGEQVVIFGQGIVGLLTTAILARFPLAQLITVDPLALRRETSLSLGAGESLDPFAEEFLTALQSQVKQQSGYTGADLAYELTGNPTVLNQAIAVTGFNGRIVIGSWYGEKQSTLDLGGKFHRSRISLISSQVSTMTPELSARWSKQRRFSIAWDMIRKIGPGRLITHSIDFSEAYAAYELLDQQAETTLQIVLRY